MEKYEITKEQILEIYKYGCGYVCTKLEELYPSAFKKELGVGKWITLIENADKILIFKLSNENTSENYGFKRNGDWFENKNESWSYNFRPEEWREATDEEVEEALENEVIKRFGKDWQNAKIEKCLVHGDTNLSFVINVTTNQIWNKNGCIYKNGVFAEPLKSKVISIEKAEKILSKKYGKQVEIK